MSGRPGATIGIVRGLSVSLVAATLLLVALEAAASAYGAYRRWSSLRKPDGPLRIVRDPVLGWRPAPNRVQDLGGTTAGGEPRRFTTDARGYRRDDVAGREAPPEHGKRAEGRPLLLVVGDSYTHGQGIADGALFYDHVADDLGFDVVALGVGGYGVVQHWLHSRQQRARLPAPDILLLQLCDNDVINDSFELERRSFLNNNLLPRPYLQGDGSVRIRDPRRWFERLTLGRQVTRRFLAPRAQRERTSIEHRIEGGEAEALDLYQEALATTAAALVELRSLFPEAQAVAFNVSGSASRRGRDLLGLSREAGFRTYRLEEHFDGEEDLFLADGVHWNERAHRIAGEALRREINLLLAAPRAAPGDQP